MGTGRHGGDGSVLELDSSDGCTACVFQVVTGWDSLKRRTPCRVNPSSVGRSAGAALGGWGRGLEPPAHPAPTLSQPTLLRTPRIFFNT